MVGKVIKITATAHRPLTVRLHPEAATPSAAFLKHWAKLSPADRHRIEHLVQQLAKAG